MELQFSYKSGREDQFIKISRFGNEEDVKIALLITQWSELATLQLTHNSSNHIKVIITEDLEGILFLTLNSRVFKEDRIYNNINEVTESVLEFRKNKSRFKTSHAFNPINVNSNPIREISTQPTISTDDISQQLDPISSSPTRTKRRSSRRKRKSGNGKWHFVPFIFSILTLIGAIKTCSNDRISDASITRFKVEGEITKLGPIQILSTQKENYETVYFTYDYQGKTRTNSQIYNCKKHQLYPGKKVAIEVYIKHEFPALSGAEIKFD